MCLVFPAETSLSSTEHTEGFRSSTQSPEQRLVSWRLPLSGLQEEIPPWLPGCRERKGPWDSGMTIVSAGTVLWVPQRAWVLQGSIRKVMQEEGDARGLGMQGFSAWHASTTSSTRSLLRPGYVIAKTIPKLEPTRDKRGKWIKQMRMRSHRGKMLSVF